MGRGDDEAAFRMERSQLLKDALRTELNDPEHKAELERIVIKAIESWLDKKWADFGKFSFKGFMALTFAVLAGLWLIIQYLRTKGVF